MKATLFVFSIFSVLSSVAYFSDAHAMMQMFAKPEVRAARQELLCRAADASLIAAIQNLNSELACFSLEHDPNISIAGINSAQKLLTTINNPKLSLCLQPKINAWVDAHGVR
jgi:hypothetical protein